MNAIPTHAILIQLVLMALVVTSVFVVRDGLAKRAQSSLALYATAPHVKMEVYAQKVPTEMDFLASALMDTQVNIARAFSTRARTDHV